MVEIVHLLSKKICRISEVKIPVPLARDLFSMLLSGYKPLNSNWNYQRRASIRTARLNLWLACATQPGITGMLFLHSDDMRSLDAGNRC